MKLPLNRRQILLAGAMAALNPASQAQPAPVERAVVELWPGGAPGGERVKVRELIVDRTPSGLVRDRIVQHVTKPVVTLFPPKITHNGITLLIVPGGSYERVAIDKEGVETAELFSARGFSTAVLRYRLPGDGWAAGPDAPVHDAMRALRVLRQRRASEGAAPGVFGVIGFSAGGHLCARLATEFDLDYPPRDEAYLRSDRPDFAVLMYPVIATTGVSAHARSARQLLASGVTQANLALYSPNLKVSPLTPPTMLVHAGDDESVLVENSLLMYEALRRAKVRNELHVFENGGHGFGLRGVAGKAVAAWPTLVENWVKNIAATIS